MTQACDHCGKHFDAVDLRPLNRIEEVLLNHAGTVEDGPSLERGRRRWFTPTVRDPRVIVSTPRYQYVHAAYRLCSACYAESAHEERSLSSFQQRATTTVAVVVGILGILLLAIWAVKPSLYTELGLRPAATTSGPTPPPTTQPYKPPFDAATPAASN